MHVIGIAMVSKKYMYNIKRFHSICYISILTCYNEETLCVTNLHDENNIFLFSLTTNVLGSL